MGDENRQQDDSQGPAPTAEVSQEGRDAGATPRVTLPDDALIIVPVRSMVLFPGVVLPITVGRERSVAASQEAARTGKQLGVILQRDPDVDLPAPQDLHRVGTVGSVLRYITGPDGSHHVVCRGEQRFQVEEYIPDYPFLVARVSRVEEGEVSSAGVEARMTHLKQQVREALQLLPQVPNELMAAVQSIDSPSGLTDLVASFLDLKPQEKQEVLETFDVEARLERITELLARRIQVLQLTQEISEQTRQSLEERQREHLLREQMQTIQKELGEADEKAAEVAELKKAVEDAGMPEEVRQQAEKELRRLERMPEAAAEYSMVRTYLDWLIELPWKLPEEAPIDIAQARRILDEDHYGLEKIKRRILEHLAVRKLSPAGKAPILCFVGPPGVGKTSLGQSIARAMDRPFVRASLGGVHDEAEIRGHRRTYIGALPGNILQNIRKAEARNCVFMLDELDKLGAGFHGDPSSALLEVLDPEQNSTFRDNYLGVPYDLSRVFFIGTANVIDNIPGPLRDRMEIIELAGYTEDEKLQIAKRYLVKRRREANGLAEDQVDITDQALLTLIRDYTREAGCRNLERQIGAVFRHAAMCVAEGTAEHVHIDAEDLHRILGPRRFESELAMRTSVSGVATGLAWTPVGGDILFVEASRVPGSGRLILTGQLGDVMKESAQAAMSLVKSRASALGASPGLFKDSDVHIHVPAGAIPKDGPSAGVAIFTALVSLLTGRHVDSGVAMTGEISLRGLVLPVGGIKEKVVAAARAGIKTVMLPGRNRKDWEEIPEAAREKVDFVWIDDVDAAVETAVPAVGRPVRGDGAAETPSGATA